MSAVKELLCGQNVKVSHVAVEDKFGEVGPQNYLQEQFGLTSKEIVSKMISLK